MKRSSFFLLLVFLALAAGASLLWSPLATALERVAPGNGQADNTIFLPTVSSAPGPPNFQIISPEDGWTIGGILYFAAQAADDQSVSSISFFAGSRELGTDSSPEDGFRAFLNASDYTAGPLTLTAVGRGPSGETTVTIDVTIEPAPLSSAVIGEKGGVLASETGSIITVPPGAVPDGTSISVDELTQEETTARHGLEWDDIGVTFLGAQEIDSTSTINKPLRVASADFAARVQPGQAVVNYMLAPDADGDGVSELVVVNSASVAPNGDVVSDPVPKISILATTTTAATGSRRSLAPAADIIGPPGTFVEIEGSGFNPYSAMGNVAVFRSTVDATEIEVPAQVTPETNGLQTLSFSIPLLPAGPATLTLRNLSTESTAGPFDVTVEEQSALSDPAAQIIDEFFAASIAYLNGIQTTYPEQAGEGLTETIDELETVQAAFAELATDSSPEVQAYLEDGAALIVDSGVMGEIGSGSRRLLTLLQGCLTKGEKRVVRYLNGVGGILLGAACALAFTPVGGVLCAAGVAIGILTIDTFFYDPIPECPPPPPCPPSPGNSGGGTTGMGAAPPPGGPGCGNTGSGGGGGLLASVQDLSGKYVVKLFSGGTPLSFSGMTDTGGYFYIPLIPAGEPFTAIAFDTGTGETRTTQGVGPPLGESVYLAFNFGRPDETGTQIAVGEVISDQISSPGELLFYQFEASAGQTIFFDNQGITGPIGLVDVQLLGTTGEQIFRSCLGCGDPGNYTLPAAGKYTLIVGEANTEGTGSFQIQLWDVPAPNEFAISVGDTISDGVPAQGAGNLESPGVFDVYTFSATAGQEVFVDILASTNAINLIDVQMLDTNGDQIFRTCLGCGDPGSYVLPAVGTYTILVGEDTDDGVGPYSFKLWDVPPPDEFSISVGDTISDGVPGDGAGNIESPGVFDVYTFSATAGQEVFVDFLGTTGTINLVDFQMLDTNGDQIFRTCLGCGDPGAYVLPATGTYTILAGERNDDGSGTYSFKLWDVPAADEFAINVGDTVSDGVPGEGAGNIESPGVFDIYTFSVNAGDDVLFDLLGTTGDINVVDIQLLDPNGAEVFITCLGCGDPGRITLTVGGEYTLLVGESNNDGVGTYSFELAP